MNNKDWLQHLLPVLSDYGKRKSQLAYKNRYQLLVMAVLAAQDSDAHINAIAPTLFQRFPSVGQLAATTEHELSKYINSVRNFRAKGRWLLQVARTIGDESRVPTTLPELMSLPGVSRSTANLIMREFGVAAEGIFVDLHVRRVAPRIGLASTDRPDKLEQELMEALPRQYWRDTGMALSSLGREICRPINPKCPECRLSDVCIYYNTKLKVKATP